MLQNSKVLAFTISELFRENQQGVGVGGGGKILVLPLTQIRVKEHYPR